MLVYPGELDKILGPHFQAIRLALAAEAGLTSTANIMREVSWLTAKQFLPLICFGRPDPGEHQCKDHEISQRTQPRDSSAARRPGCPVAKVFQLHVTRNSDGQLCGSISGRCSIYKGHGDPIHLSTSTSASTNRIQSLQSTSSNTTTISISISPGRSLCILQRSPSWPHSLPACIRPLPGSIATPVAETSKPAPIPSAPPSGRSARTNSPSSRHLRALRSGVTTTTARPRLTFWSATKVQTVTRPSMRATVSASSSTSLIHVARVERTRTRARDSSSGMSGASKASILLEMLADNIPVSIRMMASVRA